MNKGRKWGRKKSSPFFSQAGFQIMHFCVANFHLIIAERRSTFSPPLAGTRNPVSLIF